METILKVTNNGDSIKLESNITLAIHKKERLWFAYSPQFKTFGCSYNSAEEAKADFKTALDIFFQVHIHRNTLEFALSKLGWKKDEGVFIQPKYYNISSNRTLVPYSIAS